MTYPLFVDILCSHFDNGYCRTKYLCVTGKLKQVCAHRFPCCLASQQAKYEAGQLLQQCMLINDDSALIAPLL